MPQVIFVLIIILSIALLIPYWQLMRRLGKVEAAFLLLEEALRKRLESISERLSSSTEENELKELCETVHDAETEELLKSYPKIEKIIAEKGWEPIEDDGELTRLGDEYNKAIEPYNIMIKKFPWKAYTFIAASGNHHTFQ